MNTNITMYNRLVDQMLLLNFPDVWFQGIYSFLDNKGMLSLSLTRENDKIHLGPKGIARLVTYMKVCVFRREKLDGHYQTEQESASQGGSPGPS